jgi:hypothetical protein
MKNIIITLLLIALGLGYSSCKKTFNCTCSTTPNSQSATNSNTVTNGQSTGYVNQIHYPIKAWNSESALSKCQDNYEKSGYVINGYKCSLY